MVFVPFVPVFVSPYAKFPMSLPNAVVHISCVPGSCARFLYLVIVFPVMGCTTPANAYACVLRTVNSRFSNCCTAMFVNIRGVCIASLRDRRIPTSTSCCDFFCLGGLTFWCFGVGTIYVTKGVYVSLFTTRISPSVFFWRMTGRMVFCCSLVMRTFPLFPIGVAYMFMYW